MNWTPVKTQARQIAAEVYGKPLTKAEAAALRWALVLAETEDEREAQNREAAEVTAWLQAENAAALYMEGDPRTPAQRAADEDWQDEMNTREAVRPGY